MSHCSMRVYVRSGLASQGFVLYCTIFKEVSYACLGIVLRRRESAVRFTEVSLCISAVMPFRVFLVGVFMFRAEGLARS